MRPIALPSRRIGAVPLVLLLLLSMLLLDSPTARAAAPLPQVASTRGLPTVQINGVAWTQIVVGGTVYVGGSFSTARPAGAASGRSTVRRTGLLAYDLRTGRLIRRFTPVLNGQVRGIVASADHARVFIVGDFTSVGHRPHRSVAALSATTGAPVASFRAGLNAPGYAIARAGGTLFVGGSFTAVNGSRRSRAAALSTAGKLRRWAPKAAGYAVRAIAVAPDRRKVLLGGAFTSVNGHTRPGKGLAAVDVDRGRSLPWATGTLIHDGGPHSAIFSLSSSGSVVTATGYSFSTSWHDGNLEGTVAMNWRDGSLKWLEDCHGDTYSSAAFQGAVYIAGHPHNCANVGGYGEMSPAAHRAVAFSAAATHTLLHNTKQGPGSYQDFGGKPAPTLLDWYPDLHVGTYTGTSQAAWSVTAGGNYLLYAGEFTAVNGVAQQGLVRFLGHPSPAVAVAAPHSVGRPTTVALGPTSVAARWAAPTPTAGVRVTGYRIVLYRGGERVRVVRVGAATRALTSTGLRRGTRYLLSVIATSTGGNAKASTGAAVTTHRSGSTVSATRKPGRVAPPTAIVAGTTSGTVRWSAPSVRGAMPITRYRVRPYLGSKLVTTVFSAGTARTTALRGLKAGTSYAVTVRAENFAGYGLGSTAVRLHTRG